MVHLFSIDSELIYCTWKIKITTCDLVDERGPNVSLLKARKSLKLENIFFVFLSHFIAWF